MKLTILLLFLSILTFGQIRYSPPRTLYNVRTIVTPGTQPLLSDASAASIVCYGDSCVYGKVNGQQIPLLVCYPYSPGQKKLILDRSTRPKAKYSTVKKQYNVITNSIPGNLPLLIEAKYANDVFYNDYDSLVYAKRNGQIDTIAVCFKYAAIPVSEYPALATRYYISPTGSDGFTTAQAHNVTTPLKSITKAWAVAVAGDTIMVKGGTYTMTTGINLVNKSGAVVILAYNGVPVFDYSAATLTASTTALHIRNVNNLTIKGLRITGMAQRPGGSTHYGIRLYDNVQNCRFENITTDHIGGTGLVIAGNSSGNVVYNCDSYYNSDPYAETPYGSGDGFQSAGTGSNTFRGCRAWNNSDDGFDFRLVNGLVTIDSCWAVHNGYIPGAETTGGNGEGFKLGPKGLTPSTTATLRVVTRCISSHNRTAGYFSPTEGYYTMYLTLYNNVAHHNGGNGFRFVDAGMVATMKNNIAYENTISIASNPNTNNSWNIGTVSDSDFKSLDYTEMLRARQSNGRLPVVDYMFPVSGSMLIDSGVDVGLPFNGVKPDVGAFEY